MSESETIFNWLLGQLEDMKIYERETEKDSESNFHLARRCRTNLLQNVWELVPILFFGSFCCFFHILFAFFNF